MAYRRRQQQQVGRVSTTLRADVSESLNNYNHDFAPPPTAKEDSSSSSSSSSLAAKAIRASSAYNDSSLSSAYGQSALSSPRESIPVRSSPSSNKDSSAHEYTSMKNMNEPKQGFWGVLTRKAKAIIDDDNAAQPYETRGKTKFQMSDKSAKGQGRTYISTYQNTYNFSQSCRKTDSPSLQKGLDAIASSFNHIGGTIGNALEEGLTTVENRTADIIQETRKIQIRQKNNSSTSQNQTSTIDSLRQQPMMQTHTQLKASRDVAMAMAAKAKLLLRELKTVKADLAFAKERCSQLEEENKVLRESREKGDNPEDDDLIRLQLETLLAEKARLAQENSVYARENRFLREIVEYHQLTMQDVVYLDERSEEVTEVYPVKVSTGDNQQPFGTLTSLSPTPTPTVPIGAISHVTSDVSPHVVPSLDPKEVPETITSPNPYIHMPAEDLRRY